MAASASPTWGVTPTSTSRWPSRRGYAPFEQYDTGDEQRQGPWSDIYGLAATLYHVMTGSPAADALTRGMCLLNGDPDPLVPAMVCAPGRLSSRLLGAVDRGLAFKACDRPQSVSGWRVLFPARSAVHSLRSPVRTEALGKSVQGDLVAARLKAAPRATSSRPRCPGTALPTGAGTGAWAATRRPARRLP